MKTRGSWPGEFQPNLLNHSLGSLKLVKRFQFKTLDLKTRSHVVSRSTNYAIAQKFFTAYLFNYIEFKTMHNSSTFSIERLLDRIAFDDCYKSEE